MTYQRQSEVPKKFDQSYEDAMDRLLQRTNTAHVRYPTYCYSCKGIGENPHGERKAPDACMICGKAFSEDNPCMLPDFGILQIYPSGKERPAYIFVHGDIHFKNEKRKMHDYRQYVELLQNDFKPFVILNDTIATATWSVLVAWLCMVKEAIRNDARYLEMYAREKELGYLQRAVLERYQ